MRASHKKVGYGQKELARRKAFYHRLRVICEKMVGMGYFELLPESSLRLMYLHRYPPVTVRPHNGHVMNSEEFREYKETLAELLSAHYIDTLSGEKISYARFLTDALILIHFVQYRAGNRIRGFARLCEAFAPYFTTTEWFAKQRRDIIEIMCINDLQLYDFYRGTVRFSFERMAIEKFGGSNVIHVHRLGHSTQLQNIDGKKRAIVRMGVPSATKIDEFDWIAVKPSELGIMDVEGEMAMPIYAQQHALDRFEERAVFWRGYVQPYLGYVFRERKAKTIVRKGYVLLECCLGAHKVGYFVISQHEDKWLVRTFLFLTNEGTPEGNKLKKLTRLQIEDKKYLMIDRMNAFLTYDIAGDEGLRSLFNKAGCSSLLNYAKVMNSYGADPLKNPDFIYRYMSRLG